MPDLETLRRIDRACDDVARATGDADVRGPLTVYRARHGWPLAARPTPGATTAPDADDVAAVVAAQREAGVPVALEWIDETVPGLARAADAAGLTVVRRPLLVLRGTTVAPLAVPADVEVALTDPDEPRFGAARAAVDAGFHETDALRTERAFTAISERARAGALRVCGAWDDRGPVGGGTSVWSGGEVVELTGIAVLPRARRRGIGAAITSTLAADALAGGASLVWLSATDDAVARVYARVGFVRVGTAVEASDG